MAYDIRLSTDYLNHHKILKLKLRCGAEAVFAHLDLMFYARENRPEGVFTGMDKEDITLIIRSYTNVDERSYVVDTMIEIGLLEVSKNGEISLHDWEEHNPYSTESVKKSDKNRLSQLANHIPNAYKELIEQGITELSKKDYQTIKERYTNVSTNVSTNVLPPVPSPQSPVPNPDIKEEEANKLSSSFALNEKKVTNKLPKIAYDFEFREWKNITDADVKSWNDAYPACDIQLALSQMSEWLLSNPSKRKSEYRRFITTWLKKEQDRGGNQGKTNQQNKPFGSSAISNSTREAFLNAAR